MEEPKFERRVGYRPKFLAGMVLPPASGITRLEGLFPGKKLLVDDNFRKIIEAAPVYQAPSLRCGVFQMTERDHASKDTSVILDFETSKGMNISLRGNPPTHHDHLSSLLRYFGAEGSFWFENQKEVGSCIIIGYIQIEGHVMVLCVEKEHENLNLHARPINRWIDQHPLVIVIYP